MNRFVGALVAISILKKNKMKELKAEEKTHDDNDGFDCDRRWINMQFYTQPW